MKKLLFICILILSINHLTAQEMSLHKLDKMLTEISDSIVSNKSQWQFKIKQVPFICIADSLHNRMRIISPILESNQVTEELKTATLMANFHTALDVKYAISDDILWSIFVHPLKELTEKQVLNAVSQVYYANINFGTTFSSTSLVFPGNLTKKEKPKKKQQLLKRI